MISTDVNQTGIMPSTPHLRTLRSPSAAFVRSFDLPRSIGYYECYSVIQHVFIQHDVLRLKMEVIGDAREFTTQPPDTPPPISMVDISNELRDHTEMAIESCIAKFKADFPHGIVFAQFVYITTIAEEPDCLVAILDHIVYDTYALELLEEDIGQGLSQAAQGLPIDLGHRSISYRGYWLKINEFLESDISTGDRDYWRNTRWSDVCKLPVDYPRGLQSFSWAWDTERRKIVPHWDTRFRTSTRLSLDTEASQALLGLKSRKRGLLIERVLCGLLLSMQEYCGQRDNPLSITLITNKRVGVLEDVDMSRTLGNFACRCHAVFNCQNILDRAEMFNMVCARMAELPHGGKTQDIVIDFDTRVSGYVLSGAALNYMGRSTASVFDSNHTDASSEPQPSEIEESLPGMVRWPEYVFDGLEQGQDYLIRLHFVEPVFDTVGDRFFDIWLNGELAVSRLDIIGESGAKFKAIARDIPCASDAHGRITLNFVSYSTSEGKTIVSGIEILEPLTPRAFDIPRDYSLFHPTLRINAGGSTESDYLSDEHQCGGEMIAWSNAIDISGVQSSAPMSVYASGCCSPAVYDQPHFPAITFQCGISGDKLQFNILYATNLYRYESIQRLGGLLLDNLRHLAETES